MHFTGGSVRRTMAAVVAVFALAVVGIVGVGAAAPAHAANAATFDPGNIIDDSIFYNTSSMTAQQVQDFLNAKGPACVAGYTCLKTYSVPTTTRAAVANRCNGYTGQPSETAAQIIWNVAQTCGINPQVLIVLLQKEQGLVTSSTPSSNAYRSATGYGCPDTAACDSLYYGFYNQVYMAAYQFKSYRNNAAAYSYQAGRVNSILYKPDASCGRASIYIANQATAGLYDYTPYTPNAAAMAHLYATGDSCSSYGNRNFWAYFTDWFGPTTADAHVPFGSFDSSTGGFGSIHLTGWTIDPDTTAAVVINVYVDGVGAAISTANTSRPDVDAAYPQSGTNHGFDLVIPASTGNHTVCVYGINQLAGPSNSLIGCKAATVTEASPQGNVSTATPAPGVGVELTGWTLDPESSAPINVDVYQDGIYAISTTASLTTTQVSSQYTALGTAHGYDVTVPTTSAGTHTYCAYGINVGYGGNALLGCIASRVLTGSPIGSLDSVTLLPGSQQVTGWAIDPDTSASISAAMVVDGTRVTSVVANGTRADIASAFPGYGSAHGFTATLTLSAGAHQICAVGVNTGSGADATVDCRTVTVRSGSPVGSVDRAVAKPGAISVAGWALDYDTASSIGVAVYVDGVGQQITADQSRPDIAAGFPGYGAAHGFSLDVAATPGAHQVCVYGINTGTGSNSTLACRTVTVPSGSPIGSLDSATVASGSIALSGWTIDPDTASSIPVDVYLDGVGAGRFTASSMRADVATLYPDYGSAHGYALSIPSTAGAHTVCVFGINTGLGSNSTLGCTSVVVP